MARMYPSRLPDSVKSDAERKLFTAFEHQLDDQYTIFAGVTWTRVNNRGQARPAEADFVVSHPERGILLIEVKGGGIAYDGVTGQWSSRDRTGDIHQIGSPVEQAKDNFFSLRRKLAETPASAGFEYPGGYGIAIPDVAVQSGELAADLQREMVIDSGDLDNLQRAIPQMYRHWCADQKSDLGHQGIKALAGVLQRSWEMNATLAAALRDEEEVFNTLTEEQFNLLDFLGSHPQALISGCAGSGKTFLAIEKARRLTAEGIDTLLTCYNKGLAAWIRSSLQPLPANLRVQHFHELAYNLVTEARIKTAVPDDDTEKNTYFTETLPGQLYEAVGLLDTRFDAIVVDEGQDFREDWWLSLLELLRSPEEGIFYVFYDAHQCIYTEKLAKPFDAVPYSLTQNLRNTQAIHGQIAHHYDGAVTCKGPRGRPPNILETNDPVPELQRQIRRLVNEEKVDPSDIVVLTPASKGRSEWKDGQRIGNLTLSWGPPQNGRQIHVSTIHGFKGLESPVVILTEFDQQEQDQLTLVAYSRAKSELIVIGPE